MTTNRRHEDFEIFVEYAVKNKTRVDQLDFIGAFFKAKFKNRVFVKLDSRYADYFTEYSNYLGAFFKARPR